MASLRRLRFVATTVAFASFTLVSAAQTPTPPASASASGSAAVASSASAPALDGSAIVVRVGDRAVDAATIRKALAGIPAFELMSLGTDRFAVLRRYVEEAIVREELLAIAARQKGAEADRSVQLQLKKSLASALVRKELGSLSAESIPAEEVRGYYDAHVNEYRTPERVRTWHLVVATKEQAEAALAKAKANPNREAWPKLVSEVSLDPVTRKSNGDLGFVTADAHTNESRVTVPKAVADAVFKLKDGEISPTPVQSDAGWHVIWRRGSTPATVRTLLDEGPTIRRILYEQKRDKAYKALVERLHAATKIEVDEEPLGLVTIELPQRAAPKAVPSNPPRK
jgi:parvulin-like peptidyl-prolyl isomerase